MAEEQVAGGAAGGGTDGAAAPNAEIIEIAKAVGWKEDGELDAATFLRQMPNRFHDQTRTMQDLKKSVEGITKHFAKTVENQVNERLAALEADKDKAILAGDVKTVKAIDKQIDETKKTEIPATDSVRPDIQDFVSRNPWFDKDVELTEAALGFNRAYMKSHPTADDKEVLAYVEKKVKTAFPDKFEAEAGSTSNSKPKASDVESPQASGGKTDDWQRMKGKMTAFEKMAMADLLKQTHNGKPITTEKAYVESLMESGAFEGR